MGTFSALLALCERNPPVLGGFPSQRPVTRSFDVFFDLRLKKYLSKHSWLRWFKTPSRSLWRHCNVNAYRCKVYSVNTLRPRQNGHHFPDDIFKCIFFNQHMWISIKTSPKFVPEGPINNIPSLVQIMAWRRPGDKPLSELMTVKSSTQIGVARPQ